jgi:diguanylate cyclase (GGDEF)-like protein/PAS domain S-box-containing protein
VTDRTRLEQLIADPSSRVMAFDPLGGVTVPIPESIQVNEVQLLDTPGPLDILEAETQGAAVVAYESARRSGHGTAHVRMLADDQRWWLEIFDLTERDGCFVAVATPDLTAGTSQRLATSIAPRRCEYRLSITGMIESINPEFTAMLGWTAEEVVGESSMTLIHPDDHEAGIVAWIEMLEAPGTKTRLRQRFRTKSGSWLWCESTDHNALDDPETPHVLGEILDVSREVAAESALQQRETVLDRLYRALPTGVLVLNQDGSIAAENDRWRMLTGAESASGLDGLLDRVADRAVVSRIVDEAIRDGADRDLAVDLDGCGECRHGVLHLRPLHEAGHRVGLLVTLDDTTAKHEQALALAEQMRRDPLTGALNRRGLDEALAAALGTDRHLDVLYLDLDSFKSVNDTYGHAGGDRVLCAVTECIERSVPPGSITARIGGDEFLIVLVDSHSQSSAIGELLRSGVEELRRELAADTLLSVSIGRSERRPGDDFDSLIARADAEMYRVKPQNRRLTDAPSMSTAAT